MSEPEWLAGVRPTVLPALAEGLAYTQPASVPVSACTLLLSSGDVGGGEVMFRCVGGSVAVVVTRSGSSYLVADVEPLTGG